MYETKVCPECRVMYVRRWAQAPEGYRSLAYRNMSGVCWEGRSPALNSVSRYGVHSAHPNVQAGTDDTGRLEKRENLVQVRRTMSPVIPIHRIIAARL